MGWIAVWKRERKLTCEKCHGEGDTSEGLCRYCRGVGIVRILDNKAFEESTEAEALTTSPGPGWELDECYEDVDPNPGDPMDQRLEEQFERENE